MISICEKVRLQQWIKVKYSVLAPTLYIFFLTESHTYLCNTLCKSHDFLALNLNTFYKNCDFLEKIILLFFFEQDLNTDISNNKVGTLLNAS